MLLLVQVVAVAVASCAAEELRMDEKSQCCEKK